MREITLDVLLLAVMAGHLAMAPYTKVEESFNMQAMHDFLFHGPDVQRYDHHEFPGVVPRSFLGAFCVSLVAMPLHLAGGLLALPRFSSQYIVRFVLGCFSVGASGFLRRSISVAFGPAESLAFAAVTVTQFHLPFYWSRSLPNTIALVFTTTAAGFWVRGYRGAAAAGEDRGGGDGAAEAGVTHLRTAIGLLTAATVIFRCDVLILLTMCCAQALLVAPRLSIPQLLTTGLRWGLAALAATILLDSMLWGRVIWPEFEVFLFNTVDNRSSEWGTSPWHWYATRALPKALLPVGVVLAAAGLVTHRASLWRLVLPFVLFVAIYSGLPHKELRFIFHAVPPLNIAAAVALAAFHRRCRQSWLAAAVYLLALGLLAGSAVIAAGFCHISSLNYPGGAAMAALHKSSLPGAGGQSAHIGVLAAMSGVTRFGEAGAGGDWSYSKNETIDLDGDAFAAAVFTHLITDSPDEFLQQYEEVAEVVGFDRVGLSWPFVHQSAQLWVLRRRHEAMVDPAG